MKKVIFLDIDGVLNVIPQGFDRYGGIFHQNFVDNLKWIIEETSADIVISSTWRLMGFDELLNMWRYRDLPGRVIGITPNRGISVYRGEEICLWLSENKVDRYVIIDDDDDMLEHQFPYFVKTSENIDHPDCIDIGYGLTRECARKAIEILNYDKKIV